MWFDSPGRFATPPLAHCQGCSTGCRFAFDVAAQPPEVQLAWLRGEPQVAEQLRDRAESAGPPHLDQ
eukprot:4032298-Pyramimonas_sp.AAC.1